MIHNIMLEPQYYVLLSVGAVFVLASIIWFAVDLRKAKMLLQKADAEKSELKSIIADAETMASELNKFSSYLLTKIEQKNNETGQYLEWLDESLNNVKQVQGAGPGILLKGDRYRLSKRKFISGGRYTKNKEIQEYIHAQAVRYGISSTGAPADQGSRAGFSGRKYKSYLIKRYIGGRAAGGRKSGAGGGVRSGRAENVKCLSDIGGSGRFGGEEEGAGRFGEEGAGAVAPLVVFSGGRRKRNSPVKSGRNAAAALNGRRYLDVLRYYEEGMDEAGIAKALNIGRGEVSLILGLRAGYAPKKEKYSD